MKLLKCIFVFYVCSGLLLGCSVNKSSTDASVPLDSSKVETPYAEEGLYTLADFTGIIPGRTSYKEVQEIYQKEYLNYDGGKIMLFPPVEDGKYILIVIRMPEAIVGSIQYTESGYSAFTDSDQCRIAEKHTIEEFAHLVPGRSTYQNVYDICQCDYGAFPRNKRLILTIPSDYCNEIKITITIEQTGTVSSVDYYGTAKSFEYPANLYREYSLADFSGLSVGKSTYNDVINIIKDDGVRIRLAPEDYGVFVLPGENKSRVTIHIGSAEQVIQAIVVRNMNVNGGGDNLVVDAPDNVTVSDFSEIIPTQSTYQDVYRICGEDYGSFPREKGLHIIVNLADETKVGIKLDEKGVVGEIYYATQDFKA